MIDFSSLPPGDRRIAQALFHAQTAAAPSVQPRTLDEIAAMLAAGWNRAFKELRDRGLIQEQTLGHLVARWARGQAT
jgi:hypothetical protein